VVKLRRSFTCKFEPILPPLLSHFDSRRFGRRDFLGIPFPAARLRLESLRNLRPLRFCSSKVEPEEFPSLHNVAVAAVAAVVAGNDDVLLVVVSVVVAAVAAGNDDVVVAAAVAAAAVVDDAAFVLANIDDSRFLPARGGEDNTVVFFYAHKTCQW